MSRSILKNKKGFTLVELIVVVALIAVLAGTVTPSVYYSTARRQKSTAEYDLQSIYRNTIAAVTALSSQNVTPASPAARVGSYAKMETGAVIKTNLFMNSEVSPADYYADNSEYIKLNGWYNEYTRLLVKHLYQTITGLDIKICYYNSKCTNNTTNENLLLPDPTCSAAGRSTFIAAGNKDPYIVIQTINTNIDEDGDYSGDIYLILSYHNKENPFTVPNGNATLNDTFGAYENNAKTPIIYTYKIRT